MKKLALLLLLSGALFACSDDDGDNQLTDEPDDFDDLRPFNVNAPYASVITDCVRAESASEYCNLDTLPLLGQEVANPSVEDVMNRLVISHDWMADNFEEILYSLPEEILPLFKGLTAVVIDDDIRPAFYTTSTGAIYLDPAYLWLSVADKRTINTKEDYRAGFGNDLIFESWGFYTNGADYAYRYGSLTDDSTRTLENTTYLLARLIFHELAHANDFLPPSTYGNLSASMTVNQASSALVSQRPSNTLDSAFPLESPMLYGLADVLYFGETANDQQIALTASEVGEEFGTEGAAHHYGYSNQYEDAAMLFEIALMKQLFGFDYDTPFVDVPDTENGCNSFIVGWGQFNRLGDPDVRERAEYIVNQLLPNLDTSEFFQNLAPASPMTSGQGWCDNLVSKAGGQQKASGQPQKPSELFDLEEIRRWQRHYH